jgi:hypothetical protein
MKYYPDIYDMDLDTKNLEDLEEESSNLEEYFDIDNEV